MCPFSTEGQTTELMEDELKVPEKQFLYLFICSLDKIILCKVRKYIRPTHTLNDASNELWAKMLECFFLFSSSVFSC